MTISMHQSSVGVFAHFLGSLSDLLDHAAAHAEARKIDPSILLNARLYPNMYNLTRQVGQANRHAVLACALLAGVAPPAFSDAEPDISELKARIAAAKEFIGNIGPDQINGTEEKEVVFTFRNGSTRQFAGQSLLLAFSVPQFFFHVTTAYDIPRHCGVDLVKKDFWERQIPGEGQVREGQEARPRYVSRPSLRTKFAAAARPAISLLSASNR
jgi:hypothetical protein